MYCPKCNERMHNVEEDYLELDEGFIIRYMMGRCIYCNKWFRWSDVFPYSHTEELQEIEEE